MTELVAADEGPHPGSLHEEWTFDFWAPDGSIGGVMGYRLDRPRRRVVLVGARSCW